MHISQDIISALYEFFLWLRRGNDEQRFRLKIGVVWIRGDRCFSVVHVAIVYGMHWLGIKRICEGLVGWDL
jgi:hypothetical protein